MTSCTSYLSLSSGIVAMLSVLVIVNVGSDLQNCCEVKVEAIQVPCHGYREIWTWICSILHHSLCRHFNVDNCLAHYGGSIATADARSNRVL